MSQWNPAQHPRDPNNGQFTEKWASRLAAQLGFAESEAEDLEKLRWILNNHKKAQIELRSWTPEERSRLRAAAEWIRAGSELDAMDDIAAEGAINEIDSIERGDPLERSQPWMVESVLRYYQSDSFRHDIDSWGLGELTSAMRYASLVREDNHLSEEDRDSAAWVYGKLAKEWELRRATPPWEGGPPDSDGRHYQAWAEIIKGQIEDYGFDPNSEILLNAIPWDDGAYYQDMVEEEDPISLVTMEIEAFRDDYSEQDVRSAMNRDRKSVV